VMSASCLHASRFLSTASYEPTSNASASEAEQSRASRRPSVTVSALSRTRIRPLQIRSPARCSTPLPLRCSVPLSDALRISSFDVPARRVWSHLNAAAVLRAVLEQVGNTAAHISNSSNKQTQQTHSSRCVRHALRPCHIALIEAGTRERPNGWAGPVAAAAPFLSLTSSSCER